MSGFTSQHTTGTSPFTCFDTTSVITKLVVEQFSN